MAVSPRSQRPLDLTPVETHDLPVTPPADRNIPAEAWSEAPPELLALGEEIGETQVLYLRQLGPFLRVAGRARHHPVGDPMDGARPG